MFGEGRLLWTVWKFVLLESTAASDDIDRSYMEGCGIIGRVCEDYSFDRGGSPSVRRDLWRFRS